MYREIIPKRELQPFVECFWTSRTEGGAVSATRVLPDGCVDLIFDLTPGFETAFWVGTMTRTVVVETSRPRHLLGVRFHPGGAKGLLDLPLKELTDRRAAFQSVTPFVEEVLDAACCKAVRPGWISCSAGWRGKWSRTGSSRSFGRYRAGLAERREM